MLKIGSSIQSMENFTSPVTHEAQFGEPCSVRVEYNWYCISVVNMFYGNLTIKFSDKFKVSHT